MPTIKVLDEWLTCRTVGHAWDQIPSVSDEARPGFAPLKFRCVRCKCIRLDQVDTLGHVGYRKYTHVAGYLRSKDDPKFARHEYRLQFMKAIKNRRKK